MSRANEPIDAEADEYRHCDPTKCLIGDAGMDDRDEGNNQSHRKRMPDSDRRQGVPDRRTPLFLQPERNRKEPAHPRIYAMEGAESKQRQPRPCFTHG